MSVGLAGSDMMKTTPSPGSDIGYYHGDWVHAPMMSFFLNFNCPFIPNVPGDQSTRLPTPDVILSVVTAACRLVTVKVLPVTPGPTIRFSVAIVDVWFRIT